MNQKYKNKHPAIVHAEDLRAICAPLMKLNISYFAHVRVNKERHFSALANNPHFTEHYLLNEYYKTDIHMVDEKMFGQYFVWDGIEFTDRSAEMCADAACFNIHNPFTIIKKSQSSIDYYHFANSAQNKQINQIYLANLDLLNLFIDYFHDKINQAKPLQKTYDFGIPLNPENPKKYIYFEDKSIVYNRSDFIESVDKKKSSSRLQIENAVLSKRQTEVMQYLIRGMTAKQISKILNLSHRTIEHYCENLKNKLNVNSRSELISKVMDVLKV